MAKQQDGYLSAKESRRISKENRRITDQYEKQRKRKNVPESEYLTQMKNPENAVEFDNPWVKPWALWANPAAANPLPAFR